MKAKEFGLMAVGLMCFLALLPNPASARIHFRISFGTPVGHHYPGFYHDCYPYYGWHSGYYRWLDADRYRGPCVSGPVHFYSRRPWSRSGLSIRIGGWLPIAPDPPAVVEVPKVIAKRQEVVKLTGYNLETGHDEDRAELFEKLRRKKSELLKVLRIGNKANRKAAICDLAGFSFDEKVRGALEDVLLSDPDPELRRQVAQSLGKVTNENVLPALEKAKTEDSDRDVRQEAYRAIIKIRGYQL